MKSTFGFLPKMVNPTKVVLIEFNQTKHMQYVSTIMDLDDELTRETERYDPGNFVESSSLGKISYEKYVDELLKNNFKLYIALVDDICVGYIHCTPGKYERSIYISSIIVDARYRGKGIGKIMLTQFEKIVKPKYNMILIHVATDNTRARRTYEELKFVPTFMTLVKKI